MISFAGISSDEKFLVVEHYPRRYFPARRYEVQSVPGRTEGDIVIDDGGFDNYKQPYQVFMDAKAPGLSLVSRGVTEWLLGNPGYQRLEDSYDPEFYRMAYYSGGEEFLNYFNEYGRGTITFTCSPKRYFKSGEETINIVNSGSTTESGVTWYYSQLIYQPTSFKCYPLINFTLSSNGQIKIGTRSISVSALSGKNGAMSMDPEKHTTKLLSDGSSVNSRVTGKYENMYLLNNRIYWTGGITVTSIVPRWWTI